MTVESQVGATGAASPARRGRTRLLLACGIAAGPLFVGVTFVQAFSREGFDPVRHPLSLLSLGAHGWIQIMNFIGCGVLVIAGAVGMRRAVDLGSGGGWGPALVAVYGAALVWAGVFAADPADGFPPGSQPGTVAGVSWHGMLHSVAPAVAGLALTVSCVVFAWRYARKGRMMWASYCAITAIVYLALGLTAFAVSDYRLMLFGGGLLWLWPSAICVDLLAHSGRGSAIGDSHPVDAAGRMKHRGPVDGVGPSYQD